MPINRKSFVFAIICVSLFFTKETHAQKQDVVQLGGKWAFKLDHNNLGLENNWYTGEWSKLEHENMEVPGNWDLKNEYSSYAGKAWYTRAFHVDKAWENKHVRLVFESVYNNARVWLNGVELGGNELGFLSFSFDLLENLYYGQENTLTVLVDNTFKRGAMWNWGGIRRPVWLEITDKTRLEYQHITAIPNLVSGEANIDVKFEWRSFEKQNSNIDYQIDISNEHGVLKSVQGTIKSNDMVGQIDEHILLPKENVHLWHFDHPVLYSSKVTLKRNGKTIHELSDRFGIRKVSVDGVRLLLNGEPIRTVGFNLVPEDRTTGSTLPKWRIMEDVDMMKSLGANMARLSHQNLPKEFLDYLDEKGIMVFEEVALWGKDEMVDPDHPLPKEWLERMIKSKYNHPSIIGWCVGNEIGYFGMNPLVMEYVEGAIQMSKQLDSTRLAVYVSNSAHAQKRDPIQFSDLIMLNRYSNWRIDVEKAHAYNPNKPLFLAEFGHKITDEDLDKGIIEVDSMLNGLNEKEYVVGASYWTFNDYRSSFSGTPPSGNRSWGVVNAFRQKKRAFYDFRKRFSTLKSFGFVSEQRVTVRPHSANEFPFYSLQDYTIVWEAFDSEGKLLGGGFKVLDSLSVKQENLDFDVVWKTSLRNAIKLKASFVSPLGYTVDESEQFLSVPKMPNSKGFFVTGSSARLVFDQHFSAKEWKAIYQEGEVWKETEPTINDFIDLKSLTPRKPYRIGLVAINDFGESEPLWIDSVRTKPSELPPVIWHVEPKEDGWFLGYSVTEKDYAYQIRYRKREEEYRDGDIRQFLTKGVANISHLPKGEYVFQLRRLMEWGFESEWSHEVFVSVGAPIGNPVLNGVLSDDRGNLLLSFAPVKYAEGYLIDAYSDKGVAVQNIKVNASNVGYYRLDKSKLRGATRFTIRSINGRGE